MEKVFFIGPANSVHTVKWVNALSEYFEMHLIYCSNHLPDKDKIDARVILHQLKYKAPIGYYWNAKELQELYQKLNPQLINCHYASGYGTLSRKAELSPVLLSVWGSDVYEFPKESWLKKRIFSKNIKYADCIASTSKVMSEELKKQMPNLMREIYITPFGVDTEQFKKVERKKVDEYFNIGVIKTLASIYSIQDAILAVKQLKQKLIQKKEITVANRIRFYIYGDGPERVNLQNLIIQEQMQDCVFLKGKIPNCEVVQVLNQLDVFCVTSLLESFGVAVIEAMACEVPVVATKTDGFCEVMKDQETGYLVNIGKVEEIAEALEKILKNEELSEKMGKNGRKRVIENYDWDKNVEMMKGIYIKMMKKGRKNEEN